MSTESSGSEPNSHTKRRNLHPSTWEFARDDRMKFIVLLVVNESLGLADLGIPLSAILRLESTAAMGMIRRRCSEKLRHIDVRHLHLQPLVRDARIASIDGVNTEVTES